MIPADVYVPTASNAGEAFSATHHEAFEAYLASCVGGYTLTGEVRGGWSHAGRTYTDTSRVYSVSVAGLADLAKILHVAEIAKIHYGQLAIFVRWAGLTDVL
jgi:hypothetical protein